MIVAAQLVLFPPDAPPSAARDPEPRPPRIALDGLHYRIPRPDDSATCICGASIAVDTATHDRAHDDYVRGLGHLLAPAALSRSERTPS